MTAREVVVLGKVRGNVSATDRVDIRAEGALSGDVAAARISIEDGAFFKGGIDIRKADAKPGRGEPVGFDRAELVPAAQENAPSRRCSRDTQKKIRIGRKRFCRQRGLFARSVVSAHSEPAHRDLGNAEPAFSRTHFAISCPENGAGDEDGRVGVVAGVMEQGEAGQMAVEAAEAPGEQPGGRATSNGGKQATADLSEIQAGERDHAALDAGALRW